MAIRWSPSSQDCFSAFDEQVKVGRVQKFGDSWFWSLDAAPYWAGPVPTLDEAKRGLESEAAQKQPAA